MDEGNKKFCVYKHTAPNGKTYIGITSKKPEHRWNNGRAYYQNKHFTNAINLYGWENFTHEIIASNLSKEEACKKEVELIAEYKSNNHLYGYNISSGGENPAEGIKMSDETKKKMSDAHKGKKKSEEAKKAMSEARKGKPNGLTGRIGEKSAKAGLLYQVNEETNEIVAVFYGYNDMNRITGYAKTPIKETVYGIRKRAYGYLWKYQKRGNVNVII